MGTTKDAMLLKRETAFGAKAGTLGSPLRFLPADAQRKGVVGERELIAHATFPCEVCGGTVDTHDAGPFSYLREGAVRWVGVPCRGCGTSYTVDLSDDGFDEP